MREVRFGDSDLKVRGLPRFAQLDVRYRRKRVRPDVTVGERVDMQGMARSLVVESQAQVPWV